mmetsp:Transcript_24666/g.28410  ORF Transcript_24666/g.28410 Transcript_24666/m.28410 type:complete len:319 (-) Transcript_24666:2126-3082(-)
MASEKKSPRLGEKKRVLSIQSHVVSGYVGNKAAVFPLQLLGFDVDVINSVHLSNHTGYPSGFEGDVLDGSRLRAILSGLQENDLLCNIGHVLTGYIGSSSFLRQVIHVLKTVRSCAGGSHVRYVCDPVLGDSGKFYVPPELVPIYREELIPLADVVTPNQFEAEQLTGITIKNMDDARQVCDKLHNMGPSLVVITSMINGECSNKGGVITVVASKRSPKDDTNSSVQDEIWQIDSPVVPGHYTGTGDLIAALLLAWTTTCSGEMCSVLEKVIGTMHSVIKRTWEISSDSVASKELQLIQSKIDIECPPVPLFKAKQIF